MNMAVSFLRNTSQHPFTVIQIMWIQFNLILHIELLQKNKISTTEILINCDQKYVVWLAQTDMLQVNYLPNYIMLKNPKLLDFVKLNWDSTLLLLKIITFVSIIMCPQKDIISPLNTLINNLEIKNIWTTRLFWDKSLFETLRQFIDILTQP